LGKSKTQFLKQEGNTQNAIALLNYLKHLAPQQLMLRTPVFTEKFYSSENATATLLDKKCFRPLNLDLCWI
jgi:hypothetical protein